MYGFGSGILLATRTDVANSTPREFGVLQDVQLDVSFDIKQLHGQNQFAIDAGRGKGKVSGKAKFGRISGLIYADLFFGETKGVTLYQVSYQESKSIPATPGPYTVTATNTTGFVDKGVRFTATGVPLTLVASAPTTGQYSVNTGTGVYTFAAADQALGVLLTYEYTAASGGTSFTISNHLMGYSPRFQIDFNMQYENTQAVFSLFSCLSPKLAIPTKLDDYTIQEFDFECYANAANQIGIVSVGDAL